MTERHAGPPQLAINIDPAVEEIGSLAVSRSGLLYVLGAYNLPAEAVNTTTVNFLADYNPAPPAIPGGDPYKGDGLISIDVKAIAGVMREYANAHAEQGERPLTGNELDLATSFNLERMLFQGIYYLAQDWPHGTLSKQFNAQARPHHLRLQALACGGIVALAAESYAVSKIAQDFHLGEWLDAMGTLTLFGLTCAPLLNTGRRIRRHLTYDMPVHRAARNAMPASPQNIVSFRLRQRDSGTE